jgi:DNA polymerase-3 subunit epsilon
VLTDEFLRQHPFFEDIVENLCEFLGDSDLVAHNAGFDRDFLNFEFGRCKRAAIEERRFVDTLLLARRRHPNGPNSLDALCARYGIDNSARIKHGALLDAQILAEVYLELLGGRQATFLLTSAIQPSEGILGEQDKIQPRIRPLQPRLTPADERAHAAFLATLSDPLWTRYRPVPPAFALAN